MCSRDENWLRVERSSFFIVALVATNLVSEVRRLVDEAS
jgi:hypothetical protein